MILVIAGTNRPQSSTLRVARLAESVLKEAGKEVFFVDLQRMPASLYQPSSYAEKPPEFADYQKAVWEAQGILTVVPEYNGAYPGALKYFIDMLKFPESLVEMPAGFIGIGSGEWGSLRAVEQLEMVFHYRRAHLYGNRVFIKDVRRALDEAGRLKDPVLAERFAAMLRGFADFAEKIRPSVPKA